MGEGDARVDNTQDLIEQKHAKLLETVEQAPNGNHSGFNKTFPYDRR